MAQPLPQKKTVSYAYANWYIKLGNELNMMVFYKITNNNKTQSN